MNELRHIVARESLSVKWKRAVRELGVALGRRWRSDNAFELVEVEVYYRKLMDAIPDAVQGMRMARHRRAEEKRQGGRMGPAERFAWGMMTDGSALFLPVVLFLLYLLVVAVFGDHQARDPSCAQ